MKKFGGQVPFVSLKHDARAGDGTRRISANIKPIVSEIFLNKFMLEVW